MRKTKSKTKPSSHGLNTPKKRMMAEGYKVMAEELTQFAAKTAKIEDEVLPEWE